MSKKSSSLDYTLKEGEDYEIGEDGLLVFTAKYLLKRGYCCGNGCRNCPYDKLRDNQSNTPPKPS